MRKTTYTSSKKIDVDSVAKLKESLLAAKEQAKTTKPSFKAGWMSKPIVVEGLER